MTKPFNSMAPLSLKAYRYWIRTAMLTITIPLLLGTVSAPVRGQVWQRHTIDSSDASQGKRGADGVRLADVNQDGYLDVATGWEEGGAVTVYINPGPDNAKSTWHSVTVGSVPGVEDAVLADLDGDGAVDVISCAEGKINQVSIHWAPGNADDYLHHETWTTTPIPASQQRRWMYALPMDMNNDGRLDLVIGSKNTDAMVGWLENPESPRLAEHWTLHELAPATGSCHWNRSIWMATVTLISCTPIAEQKIQEFIGCAIQVPRTRPGNENCLEGKVRKSCS